MTALFREKRGQEKYIGYIESIRRCHAAGFRVLDLNLCAMLQGKTELNGDDWEQAIDRIGEEAAKLGVEFSQSHPPYPTQPWGFESEEQQSLYEEMAYRSLVVGSRLGVKWAVFHPFCETKLSEHDVGASIALNHKLYARIMEWADQLGCGIAFENMADRNNKRRFCATADELILLVDSYGGKVGACWDFGHGNRVYTHQEKPLRMLGKRIKALHVDDNFGEQDLHLLPYLGTVEWETLMPILTEIGYEGDFIYEIRLNNYMPDELKDEAARFAFGIGTYLLALAEGKQ